MNIRTKFLLIFLLVALMPLGVMASFILVKAQAAVAGQTKENIQTISAFKAARTKLVVNNHVEETMLVASRPTLLSLVETYEQTKNPALHTQINDYLAGVRQTLQQATMISVRDGSGTIIGSTNASLVGQAGAPNAAPTTFIQPNNQLPLVVIRKPLVGANGAALGQLELTDQGPQLKAITTSYTGLGKTGDVFFVQQPANGAMALGRSRFGKPLDMSNLDPQLAQALQKQGDSSGVAAAPSGSFYFTVRYIPDFHVHLVVKIDSSEGFHAVGQLYDSVLVFALIFTLLIMMVILFFVHSITAPVANLAAVAKKNASGNVNERALLLSRDEVGDLAIAFNRMLDQLQEARNTLEKKVHERTQQLEASNKELESFSYSVSHDLRAPLRAIDGFSKILVEDHARKLNAEGRRVVDTIVASTQQMGRLIDDLLAFSRLGRQEVKKQHVDMTALAKEVVAEQLLANPGRHIRMHIKKVPVAMADASLIRQVWVNLISNAIKFTRQKKPAEIEIGATVSGKTITYFVKDNGAGFDMAYVDKLFGVFQRLHDQKDFEGTGVGLAIIKRIVERHGGAVHAEGQVDHGATMSFTLPASPNRKEPS